MLKKLLCLINLHNWRYTSLDNQQFRRCEHCQKLWIKLTHLIDAKELEFMWYPISMKKIKILEKIYKEEAIWVK